MTTDLDVLAEWTAQPGPLAVEQLAVGLVFLEEIAQRIPGLTRAQQLHVGGVVIAYCERAARDLPPDRAAVYLRAAENVRRSTVGWHD